MLCLSIEILTVATKKNSLIFIFVIMYYKQEGGGSDDWVSMKFACSFLCLLGFLQVLQLPTVQKCACEVNCEL